MLLYGSLGIIISIVTSSAHIQGVDAPRPRGAGRISEGSESAVARVPEPRDDIPIVVQLGVNHCRVHVEPCGIVSVTVHGMEMEKGGTDMGGAGSLTRCFAARTWKIFS